MILEQLLRKDTLVALRSALEDFEKTTLYAVPGLLGKLYYLAGLHDGHGNYSHWGMGKVHGEEAACRAIRTSHATVLTQVLRAPLRILIEDLRSSATSARVPPRELLSSLRKLKRQALPERSVAASQAHLMAVLHALSALVENQERASPRGASPLLPPAR